MSTAECFEGRNEEVVVCRFGMKLEFIKPDKLDPATKITGLDYVDVPGNSSVDYKLYFYAFKETQYQLKV